ncbi:MAG: cytosine permease, partial [Streptomycetaceae bacterium]|nr:cytosine permease [Streptomycetaceae bacterium]
NQRRHGGAYLFTAGWNLRATAAWLVGSAVGLLSNSSTAFTGPIADWCSGVDVSFFTSGVAGVACYLLLDARPRRNRAAADAPRPVTAAAAAPGRR